MNFKAILYPKINSIFINHLHYLAYANDLSMKCSWSCHIVLIFIPKLLKLFFFLVHGIREHAFKIFPFFNFYPLKHFKHPSPESCEELKDVLLIIEMFCFLSCMINWIVNSSDQCKICILHLSKLQKTFIDIIRSFTPILFTQIC
jgi:hypothetical protein